MKRMSFLATLSICVYFLAGCASPIPFSGDSAAGTTLRADTLRMVSQRAMFEQKCDRVDSINARVVAVNPVGTGNTEASRMYGSVDERWVVTLCGEAKSYAVTFTPDGSGGTFFRVSSLDPIN